MCCVKCLCVLCVKCLCVLCVKCLCVLCVKCLCVCHVLNVFVSYYLRPVVDIWFIISLMFKYRDNKKTSYKKLFTKFSSTFTVFLFHVCIWKILWFGVGNQNTPYNCYHKCWVMRYRQLQSQHKYVQNTFNPSLSQPHTESIKERQGGHFILDLCEEIVFINSLGILSIIEILLFRRILPTTPLSINIISFCKAITTTKKILDKIFFHILLHFETKYK